MGPNFLTQPMDGPYPCTSLPDCAGHDQVLATVDTWAIADDGFT